MTNRRKILHRNGSGTITIRREMMEATGLGIAEYATLEEVAGGIIIRPEVKGVGVRIDGVDCESWEEVARMAQRMIARGGAGVEVAG